MPKKTLIVLLIALYVLSSGIAFAAFGMVGGSGGSTAGGRPSGFAKLIAPLIPTAGKGKVDVTADVPKTEACPLNGKMYTKAERDAWEQRTPLAAMIENHMDARPQSGLSSADVMFEAIAEGGITRFMAMIYCDAQNKDVLLAPVRSARTYFIDWASSYGKPLYVHVGGANLPGPANALGQLDDYKWTGKNDLNQFSIGFPTFVRNYDRIQLADGKELPTEHTMETSSERLWKYAADNRGITAWADAKTFVPWTFKDDDKEKGTNTTITYDFWEGYKQFTAGWQYNADSNSYTRSTAEAPHQDLNTKQPIQARNVVILFTTEKGPIDENKHMLYATTGTGKALIFQDGKVVQANWSKASRTAALNFTVNGKSAKFNRGMIWISVLANNTKVTY
jgi:hypothetical protein